MYAEARPDLSLSSAEKNEDSNDATATPFQPKDEFKDANDTPDVNTDGIRSYTFNITNILNGKEVKAKQPVDFVALARSMHAEAEEAANSSSLPDQDQQSSTTSASTTSEVSAFASRLRKYEEDEERQSSASQVTTSTASEQEYLSKIVWSIKYDIVESTDRYEVMKGLARLRKLQATFGNYVLLPEGLPSSLVRNLVYGRTKKEPTEEAEVEEKEQTSVQASGENEADTKRESDESGKKEEEKEDEHESKGSSKDDTTNGGSGKVLTWLEKWKAYQPREGVRFT